MTSAVLQHAKDLGDPSYYTVSFKQLIEDHLPMLASSSGTASRSIPAVIAYTHVGDFYQLLLALKIPFHLHWPTLRLNGMHSPLDYTDAVRIILVPSDAELNELLKKHTTNLKLT
jgi:hypothetical protein